MVYVYQTSLGTWVLRRRSTECWQLRWYDRHNEKRWDREYESPEDVSEALATQTTGNRDWDSLLGVSRDIGMLQFWKSQRRYP